MAVPLQYIDIQAVECDISERFKYLAAFIGWGHEDEMAIQETAPLLAPLVPTITDAVYTKLFSFDVTKKYFVPRNQGYDGEVVENLENLDLQHPQVLFRKNMLGRYLTRLVTSKFDEKLVSYLDFVGKIHTDKAGSKSISVRLVHMNALMGYVHDALMNILFSFELPRENEIKIQRAFAKLLWIQNDFIARHYERQLVHPPVNVESQE